MRLLSGSQQRRTGRSTLVNSVWLSDFTISKGVNRSIEDFYKLAQERGFKIIMDGEEGDNVSLLVHFPVNKQLLQMEHVTLFYLELVTRITVAKTDPKPGNVVAVYKKSTLSQDVATPMEVKEEAFAVDNCAPELFEGVDDIDLLDANNSQLCKEYVPTM